MKNHIPLTSWACEKKKPACCHMKVSFRAIWETWATPPNISCLWNGKVRFWSVYVFFYKNFWVKNKGTILFTNHFYFGWKENSLKIDWDPVGRGAFRENCYDFNETTAAPKLDHHLIGKSSFKRRTEVFSSYIIGEMFRPNKLFVNSVAN